MPRPRLLYFSHAYRNLAGTELHIRTLAERLRDSFEIRLLFRHEDQSVELAEDGTETRSPPHRVPWPETPLSIPPMESFIERALERFKPDVIHLHHFLGWPLRCWELLFSARAPVVMSIHDYFTITPVFTLHGTPDPRDVFVREYSTRVLGRDLYPYLQSRRDYLRSQLNQVSAFISPSRVGAELFTSIFPLNVKIIEHGIEPFEVHRTETDRPLRFGYVGSLLPQKGWRTAVTAFVQSGVADEGVELHLFGGGESPTEAPTGIFFHGRYTREDLPRILSEIDVAVIPSEFPETFCLTLSEIQMAGLPVMASRIGALADRVQEYRTGLLIPPGSVPEWTRAFRWFSTESVWKSWSIPRPKLADAMAAEYRALYEGLIREHRK